MSISATSLRLLRRSLCVAGMCGGVAPFVVSRLTPMSVGPIIVISCLNAIEPSATITETTSLKYVLVAPLASNDLFLESPDAFRETDNQWQVLKSLNFPLVF